MSISAAVLIHCSAAPFLQTSSPFSKPHLTFPFRSFQSREPLCKDMAPQKKQQKPTKIYGFVWPRDPRPASHERTWWKSRLANWKDILSGKGPDIFVGRLDLLDQGPREGKWSRCDYTRGVTDRGAEAEAGLHPRWLFPKRPWGEVYDFKTRRYAKWHEEMWSHVAYCPHVKHPTPRFYVDGYGYRHNLVPDHVHANARRCE